MVLVWGHRLFERLLSEDMGLRPLSLRDLELEEVVVDSEFV